MYAENCYMLNFISVCGIFALLYFILSNGLYCCNYTVCPIDGGAFHLRWRHQPAHFDAEDAVAASNRRNRLSFGASVCTLSPHRTSNLLKSFIWEGNSLERARSRGGSDGERQQMDYAWPLGRKWRTGSEFVGPAMQYGGKRSNYREVKINTKKIVINLTTVRANEICFIGNVPKF